MVRSSLSKILAVLLICFTLGFLTSATYVNGQTSPYQPIRILVDASKDGGLWWFPQAGTFDATQYHQGKALADSLRQDGADVVELGRGETITTDKLRGFDLVVRVPAYFTYSSSEALAYQYSVAGGTRLLLMNGGYVGSDLVAEAFGLQFETRTHFSSLKRWVSHPFIRNDTEGHDGVWSGIIKAPSDSIYLGWLNDSRETPVLGYLPFGQGYVVFTGRMFDLAALRQSFAKDLINGIGGHSLADLRAVNPTEAVVAETTLNHAPIPIQPNSASYLPQPGVGEWRFNWKDVPAADGYELVVLGPHASFPLVHSFTTKSEITIGTPAPEKALDAQKAGYIAGQNLRGWSWRVRAKFSDGSFGAWSREQRFNILPRKN